ncbi:hypothetical protein NQ318_008723 [Aromia moschata]|uniref:Uncharacterized protein n=1 Tax=Aromia moschata TaxID=1265417 RepID=A0AAV8XBJ0_9CUCU|nr:hypothetical protein NQ318_008723 [Aromia moschata]
MSTGAGETAQEAAESSPRGANAGPPYARPVSIGEAPGSARGAAATQNRRMNAVKSNHPKDMLGGPVPKMGKQICEQRDLENPYRSNRNNSK